MYINNCLTCAQAKSPQHKFLTPPLNPVTSNTSLPADMLQIDIVGKLPYSGGYSYILTGMDVFTKYMFAQPLTSIKAETVSKFLVQWFMRHSYIPLPIVTNQGSQFVSKLLHELANILEIKLEHATVKHAQTIGVVEQSHGLLKRYLRIYENQLQHDWHKHIDLAIFQHNTCYHTTIGCPPTLLYHGRIPMNPIDIRFNNRTLYHHSSSYEYISDLQSKMTTLFGHTKELIVKSFNKYKEYYDRQAAAAPLKLHEYCVMLSPKLSNEHEKISNLQCKWNGLYRIEKVLSRSNYVVRKVKTVHTQKVHRVRLKPIIPQYEIKDLANIDSKQFIPDPLLPEALREPKIFDSSLEEMLYNPWDLNRVTKVETKITKSKPNDQPTDNTPERRTADSSPSNNRTQSSADSSNSIFETPDSIRNDLVHSSSSS